LFFRIRDGVAASSGFFYLKIFMQPYLIGEHMAQLFIVSEKQDVPASQRCDIGFLPLMRGRLGSSQITRLQLLAMVCWISPSTLICLG
jgi:hypothetical protein|tara:strand:+ start:741 stop:1004 length:264 start_codon:yes stop_codon:yes gene_type:complete